MIRQFLKLYLLIAIPVALVLVIGMYTTDRLFLTPDLTETSRQMVTTWMDQGMSALKGHSQSEWVAMTESARAFYPNPLEVIPLEKAAQLNFNTVERARFEAGDVALVATKNKFEFFKHIPDSSYFIQIKIRFWDDNLLHYITLLPLCALAVAPVLFLWFRHFWRDLGALQDVTNSIGKGKFEIDAQASTLSTLSPVASALTRMSHRVQQLLTVQRELTAAVGHELRTPITQLGFSLALVESAATGNAAAQKYIEGMRQDLAGLDQLVDELLVYSRLDQGPPLELEAVELRCVLEAVVGEVNAGLPLDAVQARLVGVIEGKVLCDGHLVARAISNLLRNAVRYARTRVEIGAQVCAQQVTIFVDDDGPGIPLERRDTIFEPFVRVDASRSRSSGGYGLGLAIVRRTAVGHGGRAWMEDGPLGGLRVCFAWEGVCIVTQEAVLVS